MLDSLIAYVTVGLAASVLGLALAVEAHDVEIADVSIAESIVAAGYDKLAVEHRLKTHLDKAVSYAASHHAPQEVKVNLVRGGYDRLAYMMGVEEAIQAIQQVTGVTGALVSLSFVEEKDGGYSAGIFIRHPRNLGTIGSANVVVEEPDMPLLIEKASIEILSITVPYIYGTYLHHIEYDGVVDWRDTIVRHSADEWVDLQITKSDENDPDLPWYLNLRGVIAIDKDNHSEAIESLKEALEVSPGFAPALINLGRVYIALESPEQALAHLEEAFYDEGAYPIAHVYAAEAYLAMDMIDEAHAELDRAEHLAPEMELTYLTRAKVFERSGETLSTNIALEDARVARTKRPNQAFYWAD